MKRAPWAFGVRRLDGAPPPLLAKSALPSKPVGGLVASLEARVIVLLAPDVLASLGHSMGLSREVEEGGFLFGRVFRDADFEGRYLVLVTEAARATHAEGTTNELAFAAEAFASMHQRLHDGHGDASVLGWYHTHLVSEGDEEGLSLVDRDLHFTTFRQPWQVAGLVCLDPARDPEGRRISFYERCGDEMVRCPVEVIG